MDNLPKTQNQPTQPLTQPQAPAQPGLTPPPSSPHAFLKSILVIVAVAAITITLGFGLLNYFNIIQLKFLPHQPNSESLAPVLQPSAAETAAKKLIFPCPFKLDPCPKPEIITQHSNNPNFQGLGYNNIASGSAVLALLDGTLTQQSIATGSAKEKGPVLAVKVKGNDVLATYQLRGTAVKEVPSTGNTVSQKEVLALTGKEQLGMQRFGKWYDMVIFIQDQQGNYLKLQPTKDGQGLETE